MEGGCEADCMKNTNSPHITLSVLLTPNTADGVFLKSTAFYFTCPSGNESIENIWKDEDPP